MKIFRKLVNVFIGTIVTISAIWLLLLTYNIIKINL